MTRLPAPVRAILEQPNFAHIATVLPDGAPHSVPVWVGLVLTHPRSRKARNIERDPMVAISITERDRPHTMAMVRGRVRERVEGDRAWTIIDRMSDKYLGRPYPERTDRVVFLIEPEKAGRRASDDLDAERWWATVGERLYKSEDAGNTWTLASNLPSGTQLLKVLDSRHVWAVSADPEIANLELTSDGGGRWTQLRAPLALS